MSEEAGRESDLTTKARLREAAIRVTSTAGLGSLSARRVAVEAGVSPGLIAHHFGSMHGLRRACDDHVAKVIRQLKVTAIEEGTVSNPVETLNDPAVAPLAGYLAAALTETSDIVDQLVDELVDDAERYLELAVERGLVRPAADPRRRAVIIMLRALGSLTLRDHMSRLLGVDLTDLQNNDPTAVAAMYAATVDLDAYGYLSEELAEHVLDHLTPRKTP